MSKIRLILILTLIPVCFSGVLANSFTDTVLSNMNFKNKSDYNKVKLLNSVTTDRLERINTNVIEYLDYSLELTKKNNFKDLYFELYMNYGRYWKYKKEFQVSVSYYYKALENARADDLEKKLNVFVALGESYRASNAYYTGLKVLNNALSLCGDVEKYQEIKANVYNRLSAIYYEMIYSPLGKDSEQAVYKALNCVENSLHLTKENNYALLVNNYYIIGSIYRHLNEFEKARRYLNLSMGIMEQFPDSAFTDYNYHTLLLNLSGYYFEQKDYKNAEIIALKAMDYKKKRNLTVVDGFQYYMLSIIYEKKGDYAKAFMYKKLELDFKYKEQFESQQRIMLDLEVKYKSKQQAKEIEQRSEIQKYQSIAMIAGLLFIIFIVWVFRSRNKALRKINKTINKQNDELTNLNATKDKFFSIIAHDLKNPIFAMKAMIEFIVMDFEEMKHDDLKNNLLLLSKSSKNVGELLENLLTWSSSQRGVITFNPLELNAKTIVRNNIDITQFQAFAKCINVIDNSNEEHYIYADTNMVITIIRNILSNAIKFTPNNGTITISSREIGNSIEFSIKDTGLGISQENIEKLFKIDSSVQRPGTNQEMGTGLGLILCKEFVEKNGGHIWVESQVGVGSEFFFTMPKSNGQTN